MTIDIEELKLLAWRATPGPWEWWTSNSVLRLTGKDGRDGGVMYAYATRDRHADIACSKENQEFIAAANPQTVLALIAEVERLQLLHEDGMVMIRAEHARIAELERENAELQHDIERALDASTALVNEVEELRDQIQKAVDYLEGSRTNLEMRTNVFTTQDRLISNLKASLDAARATSKAAAHEKQQT